MTLSGHLQKKSSDQTEANNNVKNTQNCSHHVYIRAPTADAISVESCKIHKHQGAHRLIEQLEGDDLQASTVK